jgi:hypothetical protein
LCPGDFFQTEFTVVVSIEKKDSWNKKPCYVQFAVLCGELESEEGYKTAWSAPLEQSVGEDKPLNLRWWRCYKSQVATP